MHSRRNFFNGLLGVSLTTLIPFNGYSSSNNLQLSVETRLFPTALKKGDTIGLIAPGYTFPDTVLEEAKITLNKMGYKPYYTERISNRHGYFSNTDEERAADLNHMFANTSVNGILCLRGGYGCTRIMQMIDYEMIKKKPKALIGFSDVTALLNGIYKITGLVSFHGPVGSTIDDAYSKKAFQHIVQKPQENQLIKNAVLAPKLKGNPEYERYVINKGKVQGRLCGGSLTLINALIGTPHEIDFTNTLVCIEDVEEAPYRMDRMLTQLIEGKTFKNAAGILFGVCAGCNESTNSNSFSLKEVILDRIQPLGIPAVYGMSFGHIAQNFTFPIGVCGEFDAEAMSLKLTEKPVS